MKYKHMLNNIKNLDKNNFKKSNVSIISNITLEPYFKPYFIQAFCQVNIYPSILFISIEEYMTNIENFKQSDIIIVWLNYENLFSDLYNEIISKKRDKMQIINDILSFIQNIYLNIQNVTNAKIIWVSFEDYYQKTENFIGSIINGYNIVDEINIKNEKLVYDQSNIVLDLKKIIATIGINNAYNNKNKYRWNLPYSEKLIENVVNEIYKQDCILKGRSKKCIVLDCDNVLWGGILSEDGIENIKLGNNGAGRVFKDFQRYLLTLYNYGVILTICSKNDLVDVLNIFNNNDEMILKDKHIATFQVNWNNKVDNIKKIAETLNIGLDSMIFIDDSYYEIELVKSILPEVTSIVFDKEYIYDNLNCFNLSSQINIIDIEHRNATYRTNHKREQLKTEYTNYEEYLVVLDTKVIITQARITDFFRISELSQRTNKCTNGKRYTVSELKKQFYKENYKLYAVNVSDKFGSLGLVGAIGLIVERNNSVIDLFCLSCRALGRNIEKIMFDYILKQYCIKKYDFNYTRKNSDILELMKNNTKY